MTQPFDNRDPERLKHLLTRAADALEGTRPHVDSALGIKSKWWNQTEPLIAELRRAAQLIDDKSS
jgi:hypothetical protein